MEEIVYPAIFYYDKEYDDYAVEFCDICIYTEGDTMQEAYANAQKFLKAYMKCCKEMGLKPNKPSDYATVEVTQPNGKVMLVAVEYDDDSAIKTETFSGLNKDIVEDIDEFEDERIKQNDKKSDAGDDGDDDFGDFGLPPI